MLYPKCATRKIFIITQAYFEINNTNVSLYSVIYFSRTKLLSPA